MEQKKKELKGFVIDTNVILHDHQCIYNFQEHDVTIPITVLEELDKFKKGSDTINYQAREFTRLLDEIVKDELFNGGISLGEGKGKLLIETGKPFSEKIKQSFREDIADHRILAITEYLKDQNSNKKIILVTKDINLRMKAKSLGIASEDYKNDKIINTDIFTQGVETYEGVNDDIINSFYKQTSIDKSEITFTQPEENKYFILKGNENNALVGFDMQTQTFKRIEKTNVYGIKPRNAEQTFLVDALLNPEIKLVAITGKAGTGKTLLALASALKQHLDYEQIMLARPIVSLSNKDLGFLPGDADEKIGPYMQPLFDNLSVIKSSFKATSKEYKKIEELTKEEKLIITALAFIRGRSLSNCYFIVDEAQNLTPHEIKTIVTRAGEGSKFIFTGDINQIDSPYLDQQSNGLAYMVDKMKGQRIFAHVNLIKGERSYLAELASDLL